jgi:hypothetical protein
MQAFSVSLPEAPAWSAAIAQLVEHVIRNDGVTGSNPVCGTSLLTIGRGLERRGTYSRAIEELLTLHMVAAAEYLLPAGQTFSVD